MIRLMISELDFFHMDGSGFNKGNDNFLMEMVA